MRLVVWILLGVLAGAIAVGSLASGMTAWPPGVSPGMTHLLAYTGLGGLMTLALRSRRRGAWVALGLTVLVGAVLEFSQLLVAARTFSWFDLGMNVVGAGIGVGGAFLGFRLLGFR